MEPQKTRFFWVLIGVFSILSFVSGDKTADQLPDWQAKNSGKPGIATNEAGRPLPSLTASLTVGPNGPILLKDTNLIDHLAHFTRERTPERMEHAKGVGAFGTFEVTNDISQYTKAAVFDKVGKKTPIAARFSTTLGEVGSTDTTRDNRGFAVKFYTKNGNWDLVTNSLPVYFIRDPLLYPNFMHSQRRNPYLQLKNWNSFWDFHSLRHETVHALTHMFADRGIPDGYAHMNTYGVHAYKFVNADNEAFYVKYHLKTEQGVKIMSSENASIISGWCPDWSVRELYNQIAGGQSLSWKLYIQVMTMEQAQDCKYNPFDPTKVWFMGDFPLIEVGRLTLDKLPLNYFAEIEQLAFSPANMIPGIEPSPDKLLHGRLFAYKDAQRRRLGVNFQQLDVNRPKMAPDCIRHYNRDGLSNMDQTLQAGPNYFPNSFGGAQIDTSPANSISKSSACGDVMRRDTGDEDNYSQANTYWTKVLKPEERCRLAENIAEKLRFATERIRKKIVALFRKVNEEYGNQVNEELEKTLKIPFEY